MAGLMFQHRKQSLEIVELSEETGAGMIVGGSSRGLGGVYAARS
jgi:hypothetical protein